MARWNSSRRTTSARPDPNADLPSLRRRSPMTYWTLLFLAGALVIVPLIGLIQVAFFP